MLWALLALYFMGSSGSAPFHAAFEHAETFIKTDIEDKARRTELLSLLKDAEKMTKEHMKTGGKVIEELSDITERHEAKIGDFMPLLNKFRTDTAAFQDRMIRLRLDMKEKMSRDEWSRVFLREESSPAPTEVRTK